jgi:site-specific DNA recombinase
MNYYQTDYIITNIINYLRRSRQDVQREKLTGEDTLSAQKKLMSSVLDKLAIPYEQRSEIGSGDKIENRPIFKSVLEDLKNGKFDAVAVKEITRLSRGSFGDTGRIFDLIVDKRIIIITPYKIYDPANLADLKQIRFEFFMGREEYETTKERLNGARYNAALEGKWMGQIPFGYERDMKTMKLKPKNGEKEVVQMIYDLYVNGYEGKQVREKAISTILKRAGINSAKDQKIWDTTQIKRVLTNDVYIGVSKFRTTKKLSDGKVIKRPETEHIIVEGAHDAIITKEIFEAVKEIRKNPSVPKTKFDVDIYELTGLFRCKKCEKKTVVNSYNRKRRDGSTYVDSYVRCRNGCFTTKYEYAEENLKHLLKSLQDADENSIRQAYEKSIIKQDQKEREILKENMAEQLKQQREKLEKRLKFIHEKYEDGIYNDNDFLTRKKAIDEEMQALKTLEEGKGESAAGKENININEIQKNLINILKIYETTKNAAKRNEILRSIFNEIIVEILEKGTKIKEPKMNFEAILSFAWKGAN